MQSGAAQLENRKPMRTAPTSHLNRLHIVARLLVKLSAAFLSQTPAMHSNNNILPSPPNLDVDGREAA